MKNPFYLIYGMLVLLTLGAAQYRGLSLASISQAKRIPKSIRENPGTYRSNYGWFPGFGGK